MPTVTTAANDRETGTVTSADRTPIEFEPTGAGELVGNSMSPIATGEEVSES